MADDLRPVDEVHVPVSIMAADLVMVYVPNSVLGSMPVMVDDHRVEHSVPLAVMAADLVMVYVPNSVLGSMPVITDDHCVEHSVPLAVMADDLVMVYVPNSVLGSMPVMADDRRVEVGTIPDDRRVVGPVVHISVPISVLGWSSKSCR